MTKTEKRYQDFKKYIGKESTGKGCELNMSLDEFASRMKCTRYVRIPLDIICGQCGELFTVNMSSFRRKIHKMCKSCSHIHSGKSRSKTHEEFIKELKEIHQENYTVFGKYKTGDVKMLVQHNSKDCGEHTWEIVPESLLRGRGCPVCAKLNQRKSHEEFVEQVKELHQGEYTVLGEYVKCDVKILVQHNSEKCNNHKWEVLPNNFTRGTGCPKCITSKGELRVEDYLKNNKFEYVEEKTFEECRDISLLRFDFAVKDKSNNLLCLIEYDGEYHYCLTGYSDGENILKNQQKRDGIKNKFCAENNIKLIRIPYWDFDNIEIILDKEFDKLIK